MTWATPKTDWDTDDAITTTDLNRIETNIKGTRFGQNDLGASLSVANNLPINKNYHLINNSASEEHILYLATTGYSPGARVVLRVANRSQLWFDHNAASPPSGYAAMLISRTAAAAGNGLANNYLTEFLYDGTNWLNLTVLD